MFGTPSWRSREHSSNNTFRTYRIVFATHKSALTAMDLDQSICARSDLGVMR